ncbi:protein penguin [Neodiprion lecontei]|uniref:Protein penguin n=1 Tax=Neodiprion lecontei TaxID=441921 RepID=A0A6J0BDD2_NEOLC|nr:protein penguin [Neodiprion lecontei]
MKRREKEAVSLKPIIKKAKTAVDPTAKVNIIKSSDAKLKKVNISQKNDALEKKGKFQKPTAAKKPAKADKSQKLFDKINNKKKRLQTQVQYKSINGSTDTTEKPDWLEFKKQKKELREKRREKRLTNAYDVTVKAKKIGEKLRRADCSKEERVELTTQLYELLKGQFSKLVFMHDMARIVQWLLKYCTSEIRKNVTDELQKSIVLMLQSKYAKNCVKTLLKHGTDEIRAMIIAACSGNIVRLASHSVSAPVLELAYSSWATDADKLYFKQEFYGDMYKLAKDSQIKTLADVYKLAGDMKSATLSAVKGNLIKILNKKLINTSLVHSVLLEFLRNCTKDDRDEMITMVRSLIAELSQTKDGAKSAMICLWHGTKKDRKLAMKALKDQVKNVATNEHGHMVLLALFDCIDDTVLVKKMILTELLNDLTEIASNEYGRCVILYLVARRDSHYFHPKVIEQLKKGDANETSKKPPEIRAKELLDAVIDKLLETVTTEVSTWLSNSSISMVTLAILKAGDGEKLKNAHETIRDYITDPESVIMENEKEQKVIESSGLHMMLKKLIQNDKILIENKKSTFGEVLIDKLNPEVMKQWIEFNRGCFLLITLIENSGETTANIVLTKLKPLQKSLKSKKTPGASILLKKLK